MRGRSGGLKGRKREKAFDVDDTAVSPITDYSKSCSWKYALVSRSDRETFTSAPS